jgi:hypothetical protein
MVVCNAAVSPLYIGDDGGGGRRARGGGVVTNPTASSTRIIDTTSRNFRLCCNAVLLPRTCAKRNPATGRTHSDACRSVRPTRSRRPRCRRRGLQPRRSAQEAGRDKPKVRSFIRLRLAAVTRSEAAPLSSQHSARRVCCRDPSDRVIAAQQGCLRNGPAWAAGTRRR